MECAIPHLDFNSSLTGALKDTTGAAYYGQYDDTSIGTWSTNYLTTLVEVIVTILIIVASPKRETPSYWLSSSKCLVKLVKKYVVPFPYHHRIFIAVAFLLFGLCQMFSGIQHQEVCQLQTSCRVTFNVLSNIFQCLSGAYFINFTLALLQNIKLKSKIDALLSSKGDEGGENGDEDADDKQTLLQSGDDREVTKLRQYLNKWMAVYLIVIGVYVSIAAILLSMRILNFSIYSVIGLGLPFFLMVIGTAIHEVINGTGCVTMRFAYFILLFVSLIIAIVGFIFQVKFAGECGVPCPSDCPKWIPVPNFNHNGIFHIFIVVSNIFAGVWAYQFCNELESDMAPYYKRFIKL